MSIKTTVSSFAATLALAAFAAMLVVPKANALPPGWTFHCSGTTGYYQGPNGSFIYAPGSVHCQIP